MVKVTISGTDYEILMHPFDREVLGKIRTLPGRRYCPETRTWKVKKCLLSERFMAHYLGIPFKKPFDPSTKPDWIQEPKLFKHQNKIINYLITQWNRKRGFGIFAETGTGKTRALIWFMETLANNLPFMRYLVSCPSPLMGVWEKEAENILPTRRIHGTKRIFEPFEGISITSMDTLPNDLEQHPEYDVIVFDESHNLKDSRAKRSKAAMKIRGKMKILLSGTPYGNCYLDLYSQMQIISPEIFGNKTTFQDAFCEFGGYENREIVGYKNVPLLTEILKKNSISILKEDCLDLPEKIYQKIDIGMNPKQKHYYKRAMEGGIEDSPISCELARISKLRQISSGFVYNDGETISLGTGKLDYLKSISWGAPTIIWYNFEEELNQILKTMGPLTHLPVFVANSTKATPEAVQAFNEGKCDVILAQMKSMKEGFTLNRATKVIYFSGCFSSLERKQTEDRCHRIGQKNKVVYIDLISSDVERWMRSAIDNKMDVQDFIMSKLKGLT